MADPNSRAGSFYGTADIYSWLQQVHCQHSSALQIAFDAPQRHGMPAIQVGPLEGKLLHVLLRMIQAKKVVEIGTLAGYSALQMGTALPEDGHIWTLEFDAKHAEIARENIERAGMTARVELLEGPALQTLPSLEKHGPFDVVFLDADKENYHLYGRWARTHLRQGGLLLGDNAFFFGRLLETSAGAEAMRIFHQEAAQYFDAVCAPTPDGLLIGIKK
jgi:caffeoyl-CoA O-methyltransferase